MAKYILRIDDACPTMDREKWERMQCLLNKYNIKPIIAVIPNNEDSSLLLNNEDNNFWSKIKTLELIEWEVALHGYNHVYTTTDPGLNPIHKRSEFAGLSIEHQIFKIKRGIEIFQEKNLHPKVFVAPSHTFDINTINAIKQEGTIKIISDTIAFRPYLMYDIVFIPQQIGHLRNIPFAGIWTFCHHPNTMTNNLFIDLEKFLEKNSGDFTTVNEILKEKISKMTILDHALKNIYFMHRLIK